jgi:hypothetical protein
MTIIACNECGHQVSDKAASCPGCGAPVTPPPKPKPEVVRHRILRSVLTGLLALWVLGSTLWLIAATMEVPAPSPQRSAQQRGNPAASPKPTSQPGVNHPVAPAEPAAAGGPGRTEPQLAARLLYQTTAEQLYQDYDSNALATQGRIGDSPVRVIGSITEIDLDALGHPVVKLGTGSDVSAAMTLTDDQRAAAAQLLKGESVDIQCERMQRVAGMPQGSECSLVKIETAAAPMYLAVFLSNASGVARVYVVGPMSEPTCFAQSEGISARLSGRQRGEHVAFKSCTSMTPASVASAGCRPAASSSAIPGIPGARVWHYDCAGSVSPSLAARASAASSNRGPRPAAVPTAAAVMEESTVEPAQAKGVVLDEAHATPASAGPLEASEPVKSGPAETPAAALAPDGITAQADVPGADSPAAPDVSAPPATATGTALAQNGDTAAKHLAVASTEGVAPALGGANSSSAVPLAAPANDDLATVRATDPQAADHIASYCASTAVVSDSRTECQRSEIDAWTRLVLQHEFPTLDEATRRKCNEPPFPDTFVAKERCAKYELHLD